MSLTVAAEVRSALPGMRIVVVEARGIDPTRAPARVAERWRSAWREAGGPRPPERPQDHPRIAPWREAWTRLGISRKKYPASIEALLRRALKAREASEDPFSVVPLVDFYNAVSLEHVVPAGAFDSGHLVGELELRLSRPGDTFRALGEDHAVELEAGEIVYATGAATVLTRHLLWRQSEEAAVRDETREAVFVSEILPELGDGAAESVRASLHDGLEDLFGAAVVSRIV